MKTCNEDVCLFRMGWDSESCVCVCGSLAAPCCMPIFSHSPFQEQMPCCHGDSPDQGDARLGISDKLTRVISSKVTYGRHCEFRQRFVFQKNTKKKPPCMSDKRLKTKTEQVPAFRTSSDNVYGKAGTFFKARFASQARKSTYFSQDPAH